MNLQLRVRAIVLTLLCFIALVVWLPQTGGAAASPGEFTVSFLAVGQGDAILIETPDGIQVLVDGGPDGSVLRELTAVLGAFNRTIDMVIATHPDADHIGGLIDVLDRYAVGTILMTGNTSDSPVAEVYSSAVTQEGAEVIRARAGQQFTLGASTTLDVLFPRGDAEDMESNASSIVVRVTYGQTDILLTGDAPSRIEQYLVTAYGEFLQSEILKAGHHGSRTSSADEFVAAVRPMYAVISAGADNSYGHPHQEVLATFEKYQSIVTSTADRRVVFVSDGATLERK